MSKNLLAKYFQKNKNIFKYFLPIRACCKDSIQYC